MHISDQNHINVEPRFCKHYFINDEIEPENEKQPNMTDESTSSATIPYEGLSLLDENLATRKYLEDYETG